MQTFNGFTLLPKDYLCPIEQNGHMLKLTSNTLTIHHFAGTWVEGSHKFKRNVARLLGGRLSSAIVKAKQSLIQLSLWGKSK